MVQFFGDLLLNNKEHKEKQHKEPSKSPSVPCENLSELSGKKYASIKDE